MHDAGHVCSPPFSSVRDVCLRVATTRRLWRSRRYQSLKDLPELDFGSEKPSLRIQVHELAAPLLPQSPTMESSSVSPTSLSSPAPSSSTPSSPTETLTPATSLSSAVTAISHPSTIATLTTIPPELLLRIISFLPSSTYYDLAQTSTYLRLFFNTHASQICNSYILCHLAKEAELLNSSMQDGWLLPSISFLVQYSSRSTTRSREDLISSLASFDIQTLLPPSPPWVEERMHISLATPGPQYLCFLEEYARDIGIRADVVWGEVEEHMDAVSQEAEEKRRKDYAWQIFAYAVRPFMRKLDDSTRYALALPIQEVNSTDAGEERINMDGTEVAGRKKTALRKILKTLGFNKLKGMKSKVVKRQGRMFGELPSSPQQSQNPSSTSMRSGRQEVITETRRALLWYHGVGGQKTMGPCTIPSSPEAPPKTTAKADEDHEGKIKGHFRAFKNRASEFGHSLAASSGKIMRPLVDSSCFGKLEKGRFEKL